MRTSIILLENCPWETIYEGLDGVEEYHQRNVGPLEFHASQLKWTGYHKLWPPGPLHQLCGQCDVEQRAQKGCLDLRFAFKVSEIVVEQLLRLRLLVSLNQSLWGTQVLAARSFDPLSSWSSW
ncbi:hypothetical protein TNCV_40001 [Trichonephila clavipes]|nr:hypothetical protein TNCV_40001 [Trichonephila clavipes]